MKGYIRGGLWQIRILMGYSNYLMNILETYLIYIFKPNLEYLTFMFYIYSSNLHLWILFHPILFARVSQYHTKSEPPIAQMWKQHKLTSQLWALITACMNMSQLRSYTWFCEDHLTPQDSASKQKNMSLLTSSPRTSSLVVCTKLVWKTKLNFCKPNSLS